MPLGWYFTRLTPDRAQVVGETLYQAGLRVIEVPINSPPPMKVAILRQSLPEDCAVGAGTLRSVDNLRSLKDVGGTIAVMPHTNPLLDHNRYRTGFIADAGSFTPSEMFAALDAGASNLKIFPATLLDNLWRKPCGRSFRRIQNCLPWVASCLNDTRLDNRGWVRSG